MTLAYAGGPREGPCKRKVQIITVRYRDVRDLCWCQMKKGLQKLEEARKWILLSHLKKECGPSDTFILAQ